MQMSCQQLAASTRRAHSCNAISGEQPKVHHRFHTRWTPPTSRVTQSSCRERRQLANAVRLKGSRLASRQGSTLGGVSRTSRPADASKRPVVCGQHSRRSCRTEHLRRSAELTVHRGKAAAVNVLPCVGGSSLELARCARLRSHIGNLRSHLRERAPHSMGVKCVVRVVVVERRIMLGLPAPLLVLAGSAGL